MNKVDVTKDRQEQAIYAFTLVTIIFLPLSAVASIFGMNTSDVRDMDAGMWAYWAAAVPVTLLVIIGGLWWLGELRNLVNWLRGVNGNGGFATLGTSSGAAGIPTYPAPGYDGYQANTYRKIQVRPAPLPRDEYYNQARRRY